MNQGHESDSPTTTAEPGGTPHGQVREAAWKTRIKIALSLACTFLTFLNIGAITAATPDLSGTFVIGVLDVAWAGAACPLGMVMAFCVSTYLWSRVGLKRSMRVALGMMCAGCVLGVVADHFLIMVVARFLQGAGGGFTLVLSTGILAGVLAPARLKYWSMLKIACIGLGSCVSPVVGCLLVEYWHWRALFIVVGVGALVLAALNEWIVGNQKISKSGKFDWPSFTFLFAACLCILMVILDGEIDGWTSPSVIMWLFLGLASFVLTLISCLYHKTPLLSLHHFLNWRFTVALVAALCNLFCICWLRVSSVQFMRNVLQYDPVHIARMFVWCVAVFVILCGILVPLIMKDKIAPRVVMMIGLVCFSLSAFFLARLDTSAEPFDVIVPTILFGAGYALCLLSATPLVLRAVAAAQVSSANRLLNTIRNVCVALIISAASTVLAHSTSNYRIYLTEQTNENHPGVSYNLGRWNDYFRSAGMTRSQATVETSAILGKAVSIQSSVFSMNYLFVIGVLVGAAGTVVSLFCIKPAPSPHTTT